MQKRLHGKLFPDHCPGLVTGWPTRRSIYLTTSSDATSPCPGSGCQPASEMRRRCNAGRSLKSTLASILAVLWILAPTSANTKKEGRYARCLLPIAKLLSTVHDCLFRKGLKSSRFYTFVDVLKNHHELNVRHKVLLMKISLMRDLR